MTKKNSHVKYSYFFNWDCCITTVTTQLTQGRHARTLFCLFGPSKPPFSPPQVMTLVKQGTLQPPQQAIFNLDSNKFLINSGASMHMWHRRKDYISDHPLTKEEQTHDQVLGVSSATILLMGMGPSISRWKMTSTTFIHGIFMMQGIFPMTHSIFCSPGVYSTMVV